MALFQRKEFGAVATFPVGANFIIAGTTLALLVLSSTSICCGKSFHAVTGQREVEEDTSQGSLKDQFPQHLLSPASLGNLEDVGTDNLGVGNDDVWESGSVPYPRQVYLDTTRDLHSYQDYHSPDLRSANNADDTALSNYAFPGQDGDDAGSDLQKRSLGMVQLPGISRSYETSLEEKQKRYPPQPQVSSETTPDLNSNENPGFRIRQKIRNLRNQYGDKWLALVSPYAYRKRQILYRQCFFNPISCF
ncbi:unnamed protein product [Orchesella dallaii]|uniref:Uncharacterized protein n=1 Tax=Orchesella dallaii TaxID=48710 RepID=A0ABP1Q6F7_9HEXA